MAKYGKKNSDKVLMYSIIGIVAAIIILSIALLVVSNQGNDVPEEDLYDYDQFSHVTNFDNLDDLNADVYAVYYYQVSCGACAAIKQDVLERAAGNESSMPIYLMDATNTTGSKDRVILNGETIRYTPTMLVYRDGELVEMLVGSDNILPFIDDVDSGNYSN